MNSSPKSGILGQREMVCIAIPDWSHSAEHPLIRCHGCPRRELGMIKVRILFQVPQLEPPQQRSVCFLCLEPPSKVGTDAPGRRSVMHMHPKHSLKAARESRTTRARRNHGSGSAIRRTNVKAHHLFSAHFEPVIAEEKPTCNRKVERGDGHQLQRHPRPPQLPRHLDAKRKTAMQTYTRRAQAELKGITKSFAAAELSRRSIRKG